MNDVNIGVKFFVISDKTMSGTALLGRDFISNPAVKIIIDQNLKISQNETDLPTNMDDFVDQIMHIDCADRSLDELDLNIDTSALRCNRTYKESLPRCVSDK